jgi:hypothetical protein
MMFAGLNRDGSAVAALLHKLLRFFFHLWKARLFWEGLSDTNGRNASKDTITRAFLKVLFISFLH